MAHPNAATPEEMRALIAARRTDDPTWFEFGNRVADPDTITQILEPHITQRRRTEMDAVLNRRTRNVAVVVEGMVDLGNVSAIMRSAEAFGIQDIHAIDTSDAYKRSRRTTRGADKWLDRYRWESSAECLGELRSERFTVLLADGSPDATRLWDADLTGRIAWVFGNEREGVSDDTRAMVDESITIPMEGFVESLNVSAAASIVLAETHRQRVERFGGNGDLAQDDLDRMRAVWYLKSVRESEAIVHRSLTDRG